MSDINECKIKIGDKIEDITFFDMGFYSDHLEGDPYGHFFAYIGEDHKVHTVYKNYLKRHIDSPDILNRLKNGSSYEQVVTSKGKIDYV